MENILMFKQPPCFVSHAAVGGREESRGPLADGFDLFDETDRFGQKTWECAEGEMGRLALSLALKKANATQRELDVLLAGDLQNQCVASAIGLYTFGVPYIGLFGACSTCTEGLLNLACLLSSDTGMRTGAVVTSSHNCAAERQFRFPLEYGGQRPPTAQWTATAAGAFVLSSREGEIRITEGLFGRIVDGAIRDANNMGCAMARAAADTLLRYFSASSHEPSAFDAIVTGDLGRIGSSLLIDLLRERGIEIGEQHGDCGVMLYQFQKQDVHSGASGCGCSAAALSSYFLPKLRDGTLRDILFLSTGALMNTTSVGQGQNILGIAHLIRIQSSKM